MWMFRDPQNIVTSGRTDAKTTKKTDKVNVSKAMTIRIKHDHFDLFPTLRKFSLHFSIWLVWKSFFCGFAFNSQTEFQNSIYFQFSIFFLSGTLSKTLSHIYLEVDFSILLFDDDWFDLNSIFDFFSRIRLRDLKIYWTSACCRVVVKYSCKYVLDKSLLNKSSTFRNSSQN